MSESAIRQRARRRGYLVRKSRRQLSFDNQGKYMVIDANRNCIVLCGHYNATLADVGDFLKRTTVRPLGRCKTGGRGDPGAQEAPRSCRL